MTLALRVADFPPGSEPATREVGRRMSLCAREAVERLGEVGSPASAFDRSHELVEVLDGGSAAYQPVLTCGDGVTLAMHLEQASFRAGFQLSAPQSRAALERARMGDVRLRLARALHAVPDPFAVTPGSSVIPPAPARGGARAMGAALERALRAESTPWIGGTVTRADASAHGGLTREAIVEALVAFGRVALLLFPEPEASSAAGLSVLHTPPPVGQPQPSACAPLFARGARVRVVDGPFAGRVGFVQAVDGKGGARVMLGLLAVKFGVASLTAHVDRARRPVLSTSHRKPVPARS